MGHVVNSDWRVKTVTIAEDGTYSEAIDLTGYAALAVLVPSGATGANIRLAGSAAEAGTYATLNEGGAQLGAAVVDDEWVIINQFIPLPFVKVYLADASDVAQAQSGDVAITVVMKS